MKANTIILFFILSFILSVQSLYGQVNIPDKRIPHPRILLTDEEKVQLVENISNDSIWSVLNKTHWRLATNS